MLSRSLATFMNAMTFPDYTMYPFATLNQRDFYNLLSVYVDSVFRPLLKEQDFKQEGWRLEHENPEDPASRMAVKGKVHVRESSDEPKISDTHQDSSVARQTLI